jgi:DNA-binding transcriptional ArsR family regulator
MLLTIRAAFRAGLRLFCIFNLSVDHCPPSLHSDVMQAPPDPRLDAIFAALADPTRRAILIMLLEDDMAVTDVAEPFDMSLAAISKHLVVLADASLIAQEKRGRVKWCKLDPDAMRAASVWMQGFGQFDAMDFDAFERFLEAETSAAGMDFSATNPVGFSTET